MKINTNEILNDIIHTASQAILAEDEAIKRQAMGDIVDAMASVIPCERVAARSGVTPLAPRFASSATPRGICALPSDGRAESPFADANRSKIRAINGYTSVIAKADVCGRKFYAEADYKESDGEERFFASVYEDREKDLNSICRISFADHVGGNAVMQMLRGVLGGISIHYGKRRRRRANKRAREAAQKEEV